MNINRKLLADSLGKVLGACSSSNMLPVLQHVRMKAVDGGMELQTTDLEIFAKSFIPGRYDADFLIPGKVVCDILKTMDDEEVELIVEDENVLKISGKKNKFNFNFLNSDEFPEFPDVDGTLVELPSKELVNLFQTVDVAVSSKGEGNVAFSSVCIETLANEVRFVTTDGQRLMIAKHWENKDLQKITTLVPPKVFSILSKLFSGNVKIVLGEDLIEFYDDNSKIVSRIMHGNFPDYERVIPNETKVRATVDTKLFKDAVRRLSLMAQHGRKMAFKIDGDIFLEVKDVVGTGQETVIASSQGTIDTYIDIRKLIEGLEPITTQTLIIEGRDNLSPIIIREDGNDRYFYLLVTLRRTND